MRNSGIEEIDSDFRNNLLEKRREVLRSLGVQSGTAGGKDRIPDDDRAAVSHEEWVSSRVNNLDYRQLRLVEEALDRLDAGDYGVCLACEEPIAPKRLRALSWARYCVKCQEAMSEEFATR